MLLQLFQSSRSGQRGWPTQLQSAVTVFLSSLLQALEVVPARQNQPSACGRPEENDQLWQRSLQEVMDSDNAATGKAAEISGFGAITGIIREQVVGVKTKMDVADNGFPEELEASIAQYCTVLINIKQRIGRQRFNILPKSMEFIRLIYGGPGSMVHIFVMFVCQHCDYAPKYDYD